METIKDNTVYANKVAENQLPGFYYFISWKSYPEAENTKELASTVMYFYKIISTFQKNHPKNPIAIFLSIYSVLPILKLSTKLFIKMLKQKQDGLAIIPTKQIRY